MDNQTRDINRGGFARIRVELPFNAPLPPEFQFVLKDNHTLTQSLIYEGRLRFCRFCGVNTHPPNKCPKREAHNQGTYSHEAAKGKDFIKVSSSSKGPNVEGRKGLHTSKNQFTALMELDDNNEDPTESSLSTKDAPPPHEHTNRGPAQLPYQAPRVDTTIRRAKGKDIMRVETENQTSMGNPFYRTGNLPTDIPPGSSFTSSPKRNPQTVAKAPVDGQDDVHKADIQAGSFQLLFSAGGITHSRWRGSRLAGHRKSAQDTANRSFADPDPSGPAGKRKRVGPCWVEGSSDIGPPSQTNDIPNSSGEGNPSNQDFGWGTTLRLAFQSIGIVYGDIGTSPLYVYASTFTHGIKNEDDILGVLSLIYYTIILITMVKYIFIVLRANDNGNGGTFALYSLVCRYAKVSFIPNEQAEDRVLSNYQLELPSKRLRRASWLKKKLESTAAKYALLMMTILGTSMVVGDGILTPCISVLSAVGGLQRAASSLTQGKIVVISVIILICLFQAQRFGTDRVGYTFAPIICVWFAFIGLIGIYNFIKYDPLVIKAFNPAYIIHYFTRNKKEAWVSLGGVVLCITGTEAMFADLGHFTVRSIQISMCSIVFPALICTYTGQASYLRKNSHNVGDTFYASIPGPLYWPMFAVAVAASIIASQAMISGVFSILQQAVSLGCFPPVKIVHTSAKYEGQVYIPEVNFLLMCACIGVTAGFQTTAKIGNAYGIAVMTAEAITSAFLILIMIMIWKKNIFLVIVYILTIVPVEYIYLSSVFYKFLEGGYLPLAFASVVMFIMSVWNYVHRTKYIYEMQNKISTERVREVASKPHMHRMPGLGLFYSELVQGIPPIFSHYASNITALHSVLVFVAIKPLPVSKIIPEERFLFRRVGSHELRVYRCIVRYGYTDLRSEKERFEELLIERLKEFIREEAAFMPRHDDSENLAENEDASMDSSDSSNPAENKGSTKHVVLSHTGNVDPAEELSMVDRASNAGIVYLLGETELVAKQGSGLGKRIIVNYVYNFIKRNLRQGDQALAIPRRHLLKVGMTYEL